MSSYVFSDGRKMVNGPDNEIWSVSKYSKEENLFIIDLIASIYSLPINLHKIKKYKNVLAILKANQNAYLSCGINFEDFDPDIIYSGFLLNKIYKIEKEIIDNVSSYLNKKLAMKYYRNHVAKHIYGICSVGNYAVNIDKFNSYSSVPSFSKCVPGNFRENAASNMIKYRINTKTGRVALQNNRYFNILSCPKEYRNFIKSKWDGGKIISIDYNSFDVRSVSLYCKQYLDCRNIYDKILEDLNMKGDIDYVALKRSVLALLYGSRVDLLASSLGASQFILEVIEAYLKEQFKEAFEYNKRCNIFGRPIAMQEDKRKFVAYLGQSTSSDIFNMAVYDIAKWLESNNCNSNMVALIYDQIMFDIHPDEFSIIENIVNIMQNRTINGKQYAFPVKIEEEK